jgi:hypothetical protein
MRLKSILILIILFTLFQISCKKSSDPNDPDNGKIVTVSDLLPKDNEISGWPLKACTCGKWTASNSSELQMAIDGGYELFAKNGFIEAAMQQYTGTVNAQKDITLEIQVYDQGKLENANNVFDDPNNIYPNPITPKNPPSTKSQIKKEFSSYTMKFTKTHYYITLSIQTNDDKAQDVIEIFAKNISDKIK